MLLKIIKCITIFLAAFIIYFIACAFRMGGLLPSFMPEPNQTVALIGFLLFAVFTWIVLRFDKRHISPLLIIVLIFLGSFLIDIPYRIYLAIRYGLAEALWSLLPLLMCWLGIASGYIMFAIPGRIKKTALIACNIIIWLWIIFYGQDLLLNKINHGTFTGLVEEHLQGPLSFYKPDGSAIDITELQEDYIILDFWITTCSGCFRVFPEVQELYEKYRTSTQVGLYSVHCWDEKGIDENDRENFETGANILDKKNYSFPCLAIGLRSPERKLLSIDAFPEVLVLDKERTIIFRGNIETVHKKIAKLVKNQQ